MFPKRSATVTVIMNGSLTLAAAGAVMRTAAAAPGVTCTVSVPVIETVAVSVPVIVCDPAVVSVAETLPWPLVKVESGGREAEVERSVLVKCTFPA